MAEKKKYSIFTGVPEDKMREFIMDASSIEEASEFLGVSQKTIISYIDSGRIEIKTKKQKDMETQLRELRNEIKLLKHIVLQGFQEQKSMTNKVF